MKGWGYDVTAVPSVDDKVDECSASRRWRRAFQCWADLDKYLMEDVVPFAPYLFDNNVDIMSHERHRTTRSTSSPDWRRSISWPSRTSG